MKPCLSKSQEWELNPQPIAYKTIALPFELSGLTVMGNVINTPHLRKG